MAVPFSQGINGGALLVKVNIPVPFSQRYTYRCPSRKGIHTSALLANASTLSKTCLFCDITSKPINWSRSCAADTVRLSATYLHDLAQINRKQLREENHWLLFAPILVDDASDDTYLLARRCCIRWLTMLRGEVVTGTAVNREI